jgi:hypothetical protein
MRTSNNAADRHEDPAACRRQGVVLLMLLAGDARTNRVRNKFWRAPRAISVGHQQVRRPQALVTRIWSRGFRIWMKKGGCPVRFSARPYQRHETVTFNLPRSTSRRLVAVRNAAFFYCILVFSRRYFRCRQFANLQRHDAGRGRIAAIAS